VITREQAAEIANLFGDLAEMYDDHVLEKVRLRFEPGNNMVIEWDDLSEDDRMEIQPGWKP
jgi:hypothetical protein